jgi:putative hydrolase of the HAD superfamily
VNDARPDRPAKIETVLLDAGGVLLDLDYDYLRRLLDARGFEVSRDELAVLEARARVEIERRVRDGGRVGEAWRDYFRSILGRAAVPPDHHESIVDSLWEAHHRVGLWTVAIPGAVETVRGLRRRGYRVGVVSNAEGRVETDLRSAGFDGLLETVVDSHLVGIEKPDPGIFAIALERLGARAETTIFVGDVPAVDLDGARAAGIFPLLLDRHDLYPDVDAPRLRRIHDLRDWLDEA